ncbi:hypothetical protein CDD81_8112 [Ophiocordyceps australis]|uniref:Invertebrate defensins family profile domain-containing protein n=1 Tax=Ophiocordyceps australis TaxID=1399860 RepID=A0A2C5XYR3_9HYPO|nr:hypothetical protein CDD81_8112 [Ophiocordyceps australis]
MKLFGLVAIAATILFGQGLAAATEKNMVACHECHYNGFHGGHECCHERCINYYDDDYYHGGHCDGYGWCHCD